MRNNTHHIEDKLSTIMNAAEDTDAQIDFANTIRNMGKLNPRINMMEELQKSFKSVHNNFAVYVDTESNVHLSEAERRAMPLE